MPVIFSKKQKLNIVEYGGQKEQSFSFKQVANDFINLLKGFAKTA